MTIRPGDKAWLRYTKLAPTAESARRIAEVAKLSAEEREKLADEQVEVERTDGWAEARVNQVLDHFRAELIVKHPDRDAEQLLIVETRDQRGVRNPNVWFGDKLPA